MASLDDKLKTYFTKYVKKDDLDDKTSGTLEDIIHWFRALDVFDKINLVEVDLTSAINGLQVKARTLSPQDFLDVIDELAKKMEVEPNKFKEQIVKVIEGCEKLGENFWVEVEKGATSDDVVELMKKHDLLDKMEITEDEARNCFSQIQNGSIVSAEDIKKVMREFAEQRNFHVEHVEENLLLIRKSGTKYESSIKKGESSK